MVVALRDSLADVRATACILIGRYSEAFPISFWANDVLSPIVQYLEVSYVQTKDETIGEGAIRALNLICEDSGEKLAMDLERRPLDKIVPLLISLLSSEHSKIRIEAIQSMTSLIHLMPGSSGAPGQGAEALTVHMNSFLSAISALSMDSEPLVRKTIVQAVVILASLHLGMLEPFYDGICNFMLRSLSDASEDVAKEACDFWLTMFGHVESGIAPSEAVSRYLPTLIPLLIGRLRFVQVTHAHS